MSEKKTYKTHKFLETFKKNFNLYKFYDHFETDIENSYDYYKKCNYTASAGRDNSCHIKRITEKWKEQFDKFTSVYKNIFQKCDHLVLWIYDKIIGCNSDNYCISWYYGLLENFWYESECCDKDTDKNICKNKFIKTFNLDVLKNKRDSYDFFEYYDNIKNILSREYQQNNEKYCEYIKYILKLYHELKEENRQSGLPHKYEKELDLYKNTIDKDDTLSLLKKNCNIDDSFIKVPQSVDNLNSLQGNHGKKLTKRPVPPYYGQYNQIIKDEYENIIKELTSSKIYDKLNEDVSGNEYKSEYCDNLKDKYQMKKICNKMSSNIKTLRSNSEMSDLSHRDRCTYLNFWIYREISKLYPNEDKNLTDITEIANLIDANIKINMDLINDYSNKKNHQTAQSTNRTSSQSPSTSVKNHELSKPEPCYFNYDCTFSECKEMKHLFEYFKNYDEIKKKINCEKRQEDKYYTYLKYMSHLYNKHKYEEECCSWGATLCSDYFLECDEYYDPNKLISAIESGDVRTCNKIKNLPKPNLSEETSTIDPEDKNNMYIKYLTCSYVTHSDFKKKGLRCQQPGYSPFRKNKFAPVRAVNNAENNNLKGKKLTINGKSMNAVLISDPNEIITREDGEENSMPGYNYTLFPEISGAARKAYVKQGEEACKNGKIKEGMEEYCRKSKRYNKIINLSNSQSANVTLKEDIENWEDIVIPDDTSFLNEILQRLPVRMGAVSLASLGAITMLFMYYKFTPLGSWLRNVMGGEKKMKHGNHGEPRKSLNYQQDHMPQISQKKRIKIAYQNS